LARCKAVRRSCEHSSQTQPPGPLNLRIELPPASLFAGRATRTGPDRDAHSGENGPAKWATHYQLKPARPHGHAFAGRRRVVDQAAQLSDAVRLAYCQPYVGAFFNFLLADESSLTGWQSGLLWANWRPKPFAHAIADIRRGWVDCAAYGG
jgi:hypothetical protein